MNSSATLGVRPDGVGVLTLDQPGSKVNVLTRELWQDIDAALDEAAKQPLKGLVIASAKPGIFIAGADLKLLLDATGPNDPAVRAFIDLGLRVLEKLESLPFPTCAAIDGASLGGGLEVALACDMRVIGTHPKVQLGLPEVKLGLIPGWGGTQRLPRATCLEDSATVLTSGRSLEAREAITMGLVDAVHSGDGVVDSAATGLLTGEIQKTRAERSGPIRRPHPKLDPAQASHAAAEAIRVLVEGAALPLRDAIALETEAFMNLAGSPESKRLIAEFFASRKK